MHLQPHARVYIHMHACIHQPAAATSPMAPPQGLSHYLEHMLFMGSEAFPDENAYDAYLNAHSGASNAFTETVHSHGFMIV